MCLHRKTVVGQRRLRYSSEKSKQALQMNALHNICVFVGRESRSGRMVWRYPVHTHIRNDISGAATGLWVLYTERAQRA